MTASIISLAEHRRIKAVRSMQTAAKVPVLAVATLCISIGVLFLMFGFAGLYLMQGA